MMKITRGAAIAATLLTCLTAATGTVILLLAGSSFAQESAVVSAVPAGVVQWGMMAAALAAGLSAVGAAYAVAHVGSAAVGALAEKQELLGLVLILVGLAEGIAIYGLIIAILILNRIA
jgi:V/A-type H+-transporting ATPase subunit K